MVSASIVPKSRTGEGSKRLSTGARLAEKEGSELHGVYLGRAIRACVPGACLNLEKKRTLKISATYF